MPVHTYVRKSAEVFVYVLCEPWELAGAMERTQRRIADVKRTMGRVRRLAAKLGVDVEQQLAEAEQAEVVAAVLE
jgi:hypothetical protein